MANHKGAKKVGGRKAGTPNKFTANIKEMALQALENQGGVKYLEKQAKENPVAFMGLIGKILPMTVKTNVGGKIVVTWEK